MEKLHDVALETVQKRKVEVGKKLVGQLEKSGGNICRSVAGKRRKTQKNPGVQL